MTKIKRIGNWEFGLFQDWTWRPDLGMYGYVLLHKGDYFFNAQNAFINMSENFKIQLQQLIKPERLNDRRNDREAFIQFFNQDGGEDDCIIDAHAFSGASKCAHKIAARLLKNLKRKKCR